MSEQSTNLTGLTILAADLMARRVTTLLDELKGLCKHESVKAIRDALETYAAVRLNNELTEPLVRVNASGPPIPLHLLRPRIGPGVDDTPPPPTERSAP
jgi:hypothetical protein